MCIEGKAFFFFFCLLVASNVLFSHKDPFELDHNLGQPVSIISMSIDR